MKKKKNIIYDLTLNFKQFYSTVGVIGNGRVQYRIII